jgi:glucose/arabinose dehydrogenase
MRVKSLQSLRRCVAAILLVSMSMAPSSSRGAQPEPFHGAPASAQARNPYAGDAAAAQAGHKVYAGTCASCHGANAEGSGNVPALSSPAFEHASDGEVFWYISKGDVNNGMPSWAALPEQERWQIIAFLRSIQGRQKSTQTPVERSTTGLLKAPPPTPPFTDFRYEAPGKVRKISVADLPQPFATPSAGNGPRIVTRPADVWPKAPAGFKVEQYASGIRGPRRMRTAPNGDVFVALEAAGKVELFRGIDANGKAEESALFASGLNRPFGIAFYPPGPQPKWIYIGNTNAVVRFAYSNGDIEVRGAAEHIADLPSGGHSTRDIEFSPDGKTMYVSVGSASNVDDPDTTPAEQRRADVLAFNPDGSGMRVFAAGIRNAVGLAIQPKTGTLWCSVNERDGLGDNLVPDYITHIEDGGFYGWPWWYIGAHQDPRHAGKHGELKDRVIVPDVLLHPHNASLQLTFYDGAQFPAEYRGDIFAGEHGSWNRSVRVGYEVIRVPLHQIGHASGEYEDFLTGFVLDNGDVWGRPVGVTVARDGSLLVSDDGSNSIWRVSYVGSAATPSAH